MLDKIKNLNPWIIAALTAIGMEVLIGLISTLLNFNLTQWINELGYIFVVPYLKITGYQTVQFISEFSGGLPDSTGFAETAIISGLGVFVIFILGPLLLLKGYVQADQSEHPKQRSWTWYTGAILILSSVVPAVIGGAIGAKVYMNTISSAEDSRQRDMMRSELMNLALDASYKVFLPQEEGGGSGSFNTFGENPGTIVLSDLESYDPESPFEFQIVGEVSDSSFTIVGLNNRVGKKEDFENINGKTGRQQMPVKVTPYQENIFKIRSSGPLNN